MPFAGLLHSNRVMLHPSQQAPKAHPPATRVTLHIQVKKPTPQSSAARPRGGHPAGWLPCASRDHRHTAKPSASLRRHNAHSPRRASPSSRSPPSPRKGRSGSVSCLTRTLVLAIICPNAGRRLPYFRFVRPAHGRGEAANAAKAAARRGTAHHSDRGRRSDPGVTGPERLSESRSQLRPRTRRWLPQGHGTLAPSTFTSPGIPVGRYSVSLSPTTPCRLIARTFLWESSQGTEPDSTVMRIPVNAPNDTALRLPLSLNELHQGPHHADGTAWSGDFGFRGRVYSVTFWAGKTAPRHDRTSLLRALASIRPTHWLLSGVIPEHWPRRVSGAPCARLATDQSLARRLSLRRPLRFRVRRSGSRTRPRARRGSPAPGRRTSRTW